MAALDVQNLSDEQQKILDGLIEQLETNTNVGEDVFASIVNLCASGRASPESIERLNGLEITRYNYISQSMIKDNRQGRIKEGIRLKVHFAKLPDSYILSNSKERVTNSLKELYNYHMIKNPLIDQLLQGKATEVDFEYFAANYSQYVRNDDADIQSKLVDILSNYKDVIKAKKDKNGNWYLKKVGAGGFTGFFTNWMTKASRSDPKNVAAAMLSQQAPPRPEGPKPQSTHVMAQKRGSSSSEVENLIQNRAVLLVDDDSANLKVANEQGIESWYAGERGMSVDTMNDIVAWKDDSTQCSLRALDWDGTCTLNSIHMANDINFMSSFIMRSVDRKVQGGKVSYSISGDSIDPNNNCRNKKLREMAEKALLSINEKLTGGGDVFLKNSNNQTRLGMDPSDIGLNFETRVATAKFIVDNYKDMRALALHMLDHTRMDERYYEFAISDFETFQSATTDTLSLMFGGNTRQEALIDLYLSADKDNPIAITSHGTEPTVMRELLVQLAQKISPHKAHTMREKLKNGHIICNNNSVNTKGRGGTPSAKGYVGKTAQIIAVLEDLPQPAQGNVEVFSIRLVPSSGGAVDTMNAAKDAATNTSSQGGIVVLLVDDSKRVINNHDVEYGQGTGFNVNPEEGMTMDDIRKISQKQQQIKDSGNMCVTLLDMDKTTLAEGYHLANSLTVIGTLINSPDMTKQAFMKLVDSTTGLLQSESSGSYLTDEESGAIRAKCEEKYSLQLLEEARKLFDDCSFGREGKNSTHDLNRNQLEFILENYKDLAFLGQAYQLNVFTSQGREEHADTLKKLMDPNVDDLQLLYGDGKRQKALVDLYINSAKNGVAAVASHGSDPDVIKGFLLKLATKYGKGEDMSELFEAEKLLCDHDTVSHSGRGHREKYTQAKNVLEKAAKHLKGTVNTNFTFASQRSSTDCTI